MNRAARHIALLVSFFAAVSTFLTGCSDESSPAAGPSVMLLIFNDRVTGPPRPDALSVSWLDENGFVFKDRGFKTAGEGDWLGSLVIEGDEGSGGPRRTYVTGLVAGAPVSLSWISTDLVNGQSAVPVLLTLKPIAAGWDADGDSVPDAVDNCPGTSNPAQTAASACL